LDRFQAGDCKRPNNGRRQDASVRASSHLPAGRQSGMQIMLFTVV
jgi:hypothetical protein